jgi:aryl-alcohol dehydrogenase-like predicted oxidoreductase/enamine deaminase RidA (YjgF/YER057c/UK114 family)
MNEQLTHTDLAPDLRVSRVVTGLWQIADMERDQGSVDLEQAAASMTAYTDASLTTFDMADHYGSAEDIAGIFASRYAGGRDIRMLTKWVPEPGGSSRETVRSAVQRSLDRLRTDCLDLLQYHAWNYADPSYLDDLFHLQALKDEGLIRHLGLTNFDTDHLGIVLASGIPVVSNQVCFSLLDQRASGDMARLCEDRGVKLLAFGTLAGGFLTERWLGKPKPATDELSTWSQMKYMRYIDTAGGWAPFQQLLSAVKATADRHGVSMANIASRYILEQPAVGAVIIGARLGQSEHIDNNRQLLHFVLDDNDRETIGAALEVLEAVPGDCGDEYRKPPYLTATGDLSHHLESLPVPFPTKAGGDGRTLALSGTIWEDLAGFARAVRKGNRILVSGTTATHGDRMIGGRDAAAQTHFAIDKIDGALQSLGGSLEQVVRTRVFVRNIGDWEAVTRAHGRRFGSIRPANTLVQANLVGKDYLVEVEAEAIVGDE